MNELIFFYEMSSFEYKQNYTQRLHMNLKWNNMILGKQCQSITNRRIASIQWFKSLYLVVLSSSLLFTASSCTILLFGPRAEEVWDDDGDKDCVAIGIKGYSIRGDWPSDTGHFRWMQSHFHATTLLHQLLLGETGFPRGGTWTRCCALVLRIS